MALSSEGYSSNHLRQLDKSVSPLRSPTSRLAALEGHARRVEEKMKALSQRNSDLRQERDHARAELKRMASELIKTRARREKGAWNVENKCTDSGSGSAFQKTPKESQRDTKGDETVLTKSDKNFRMNFSTGGPQNGSSTGDATQLHRELSAMEKKLEERKAAVRAGDIRAEELEKSMRKLKKEYIKAEKKAENYDNVALDLENQLSATEAKYRQCLEAIKMSETELVSLKMSLEQKEKSLQESEIALEAKDWRIEDLENQVKDLRIIAFEAQSAVEHAKQEAQHAMYRISVLSKEKTAEVQQNLLALEAMKREIKILRGIAARTDKGWKESYSKQCKAESPIATQDQTKFEQRGGASPLSEIQRLKEALADSGRIVQRVKEDAQKKLEQEIAVARSECLQAQEAAEMLHREMDDLKVKHAKELETQRIKFEEQNSMLENKIKDMIHPAHMNEKLLRLEEELKASHLLVLDKYAEAKDKETKEMNSEMDKLRGELELCEKEIASLREKLSQEGEQRKAEEEVMAKVRNELKDAQDMMKMKVDDIERLEQEKMTLMSTIQDLQLALKSQEEKHRGIVQKLQDDLKVQAVELADAKTSIKDTEELIQRLAAMKMRMSQTHEENNLGKENAGSGSPKKRAQAQQKAPLRSVQENTVAFR